MIEAKAELSTDGARIVVESPYRCRELIRELPGARWNTKDKVWTIAKSWPACLALRADFGDGLTVGPRLVEWAKGAGSLKKKLAGLYGTVQAPEIELPNLTSFDILFPHQRVDAWVIANAKRYLLMNGVGTGKTLSSLAGLSLADSMGSDVFPLLVVAPKSMLPAWARDEIPRVFPNHTVRVVDGTPAKVRDALEPGADVYVIGWSLLAKYSRLASYGSMALTDEQKTPKQLNTLGFKSIIADECHRAKNAQSQQTRALWYIAESCDFRVGLTGTPIQESAEDLYPVLHAMVPEDYPTKGAFTRFVNIEWDDYGNKVCNGVKEERRGEWESNFHAVSRRMTTEMVLDFLPPVIEETRWVTLPPKLRKEYESMKKKMVADIEGGTLSADNPMVREGRLIQFANCGGEINDEGQFRMVGPSPKVDAFITDYVDGDYAGEQIIVFSDSAQLAIILQDELTRKKISHVAITGAVTGDDRQDAIDKFQKGDAAVCVLTRAGGEGVTLTAASTMVRLMRPWSYTVFQQVRARCLRIGSERHDSIRYVDYITDETVELGQLARLNSKEASAQEVLRDDALLKMLKGI